jgi:hypothetical protein
MRSRIPQSIVYASIFAAGLGFSSAAYANALVISVDKTSQRMTVSVDGAARYVWPVSTGRPGFDTPNGTFHPFRLDRDHHSTEYDNAPMPDAIFFTNTGDAVHGFFDTPHLGMAVSHGCVRLSPANAAVLFELVEQAGLPDTTVIVQGRVPARHAPIVARRQAPESEASNGTQMQTEPDYGGPAHYGAPVAHGRFGHGPYGQSTYAPQPASIHYYGRAANDAHATRQSSADDVARRNSADEDSLGLDRLFKSILTNVSDR